MARTVWWMELEEVVNNHPQSGRERKEFSLLFICVKCRISIPSLE